MTEPLCSVVLPVHNQADHIGRVVGEYLDVLGRLAVEFELITVANGCRDDSFDICSRLAQCDRRVIALRSARAGWGLAVRLGLNAARGSTLCYTNSSRTTAYDLAAMLLRGLREPGKVYKADRRERASWRRRLGSVLYNAECRLLLGAKSRDVNGTPKVFPRECTKLLTLCSEDDLIDAEFIAVCAREGYCLVEVPIYATGRHGGRSTTGWTSALRMYKGAWTLSRALRTL